MLMHKHLDIKQTAAVILGASACGGPKELPLEEAGLELLEKQGWKEPCMVTQCVTCLRFSLPTSHPDPCRDRTASLDMGSFQFVGSQPAHWCPGATSSVPVLAPQCVNSPFPLVPVP